MMTLKILLMQEGRLSSSELGIEKKLIHGKGKEKKRKKLRSTLRLKDSFVHLLPQSLLPLLEAQLLALDPQDFKGRTHDRLFPKDFFDTVVK